MHIQYTTGITQPLQASIIYTNIDYNIHGAFPLLFISPCWFPFAPLSNPPLLTWNPPCCDRIRPPRSQVACKLTSPFSTLSPIPPPSKFPEPRLSGASLWRPQESGVFCQEQYWLQETCSWKQKKQTVIKIYRLYSSYTKAEEEVFL